WQFEHTSTDSDAAVERTVNVVVLQVAQTTSIRWVPGCWVKKCLLFQYGSFPSCGPRRNRRLFAGQSKWSRPPRKCCMNGSGTPVFFPETPVRVADAIASANRVGPVTWVCAMVFAPPRGGYRHGELPARGLHRRPAAAAGRRVALATGDLIAGGQEHVPAGAERVRALAVGGAGAGVAGVCVQRVPGVGELALAARPGSLPHQRPGRPAGDRDMGAGG